MNAITSLIRYLRNRKYVYDVRTLTVGGHCGCCGRWIDKAIVERGWEWTLCPNNEKACYNQPL